MKKIKIAILLLILFLPIITINAANCSSYKSEDNCNNTDGCKWDTLTSRRGACILDCQSYKDEDNCNNTDGCKWDTLTSRRGACILDCSSFKDEDSCNGTNGCQWSTLTSRRASCVASTTINAITNDNSDSDNNNSSSNNNNSSSNINQYGTNKEAEKCSDGSGKDAIKFKENEYCYGENEGVYCSSEKDPPNTRFDDCFTVYKNTGKSSVEGTDVMEFTTSLNNSSVNLYVLQDDPVVDSTKWWKSLTACFNANTFGDSSNNQYGVYTDELVGQPPGSNRGFLNLILEVTACKTYTVQNVPSDNTYAVCSPFYKRSAEIKNLGTKYSESSEKSLINKYKVLLSEIEGLCGKSLQYGDYNDPCVSTCLNYNDYRKEWDEYFGISTGDLKCGFSLRLISWIINIIKWVKYIIPVVVIILGILDFIKATGSDKDDDMKKAQGNFVKRLIAAALIFLVPLLVEFILPKLGFDYNSCGIF